MAAGASPRASSRPTTPGPLGPAGLVSPSTEALEKRLRAARKKLRQIEKLMTKPVAELNHQQQEKLIKHTETAEAVRQLEGELAAALHDPADSPANVEEEGAHAFASRYREDGSSSEGDAASSSSCSHSNSSISLASVVAAADHRPSEYYEEPPPPTPTPPGPPLRRSNVTDGASAEDAYAKQQAAARQMQAVHRRKAAQRLRRAREEASRAALETLSLALERRALQTHQLLMVEHVMQPRTLGQPNGRLRLDFTELRGNTRMREPECDGKRGKSKLSPAPNDELLELSGLQSLLLRSDELRELALDTRDD